MADDKSRDTLERKRVLPEDPRLRTPEAGLSSMLGLLAALAGGLALIIGLLIWLVTKTFGLGPKVFVILAAVLFIYALVANFRNLVAAFRQRRAVSGANTVVFAAMVLGILILVNIIAARHRVFRYDATKTKQFSLADQTVKVLKSLNQDVQFIAFLNPESPDYQTLRDRLEEYAAHSSRVKLEFYDPFTRVDKVKEYNITVENTVVVKSGDKKEEVMGGDEERLTSAVLSVTTGQKVKIYFLTGHGEYDPTQYGQDTVSAIKRALEQQQYAVETLSLMNKDAVPQDCAALVIAGAQNPLQPKEMEAIKKYADQGGKLFIALANTPNAPDFSEILTPRGVTPIKGQVMDPNAEHNAGAPGLPMVLKPESHDVTKRLQGVVLPVALALKVDSGPEPPPSYPGAPPPPPSKKADELMKTSAEAWLDKPDATGKGNEKKDSGEESGPFTLAAAIDQSKKERPQTPPGMPPPPDEGKEGPGTRIVVVGSAEFMTDRLIESARLWANGVFALNSINWLLKNEKLISIPPKQQETPYLTMVGAQKAISAIVAMLVIPGFVVFAGVVVWWRRRR